MKKPLEKQPKAKTPKKRQRMAPKAQKARPYRKSWDTNLSVSPEWDEMTDDELNQIIKMENII